MMRMKTRGVPEVATAERNNGAGGESEWERRPGGMLVQKRNPDSDQNRVPAPTIRVRVKYGSVYHEINISSQATFGELKKMLSGPTGLHHEDQKLLFKDKARDSKAFLDVVGVKDRSKMVLTEDPISKEKRFLEMRKNAKMEKASKSISDISFEVDRLAGQVAGYESVISRGGKVGEKEVLNLIEMLMNQLLKLDGIIADGDVKLQRKMQVKRVQKYVETLDMLKIKNSMMKPTTNGTVNSPKHHHQPSPIQQQHKPSNGQAPPEHQPPQPQSRRSYSHLPPQPPPPQPSAPVVVTTQWETFDAVTLPLPAPPSASKTGPSPGNNNTIMQPKFNWDLL